ncbi:MAG: glycosyltransferase [Vicinamibacterales bacterium]
MTVEDARVTIVVVARNAAATIERALRSALAEPAGAILVVDDASEDDTADRARAIPDPRIQVISLAEHRTVGHARQLALTFIGTPFGMWLDADDELLAGRTRRLRLALEHENADLAADAAELVGPDGAVQTLPLPAFLKTPPGIVRLFERNHLPVTGPLAFRTERLRTLGYNATLQGAEDVDLLLRAVASRCRFALVETAGYRIHARPDSLSRNLLGQREMYRRVLGQFSSDEVAALWREAGGPERALRWALYSMDLFKNDLAGAARQLDELAALPVLPPEALLEPDGPTRRPEGWRLAFAHGTLALLQGDVQTARRELTRAETLGATPEAANNLGVVHAVLGETLAARSCFERALDRRPDYVDAATNLGRTTAPWAITTHALREHANRCDYQVCFAR